MSEGYQGLGPENRGGCAVAFIAGVIALFFDFGRFFGDPLPGTEHLWWRHVPLFLPTLAIVAIAFFVTRALIRLGRSNDR